MEDLDLIEHKPPTFNDLREALKQERSLMYYKLDEVEAAEKQVDDLISSIQERVEKGI